MIRSLFAENFKGIRQAQEIRLAPLTVFIGENSSGKSTCIHALATLAQTRRLSAQSAPLVLSDDFAYVQLGRFIEVIHTKSYDDHLMLGVGLDNVSFPNFDTKHKGNKNSRIENCQVKLFFKSTLRTQDIALESTTVQVGTQEFLVQKRKPGLYSVEKKGEPSPLEVSLDSGFLFDVSGMYIDDASSAAILSKYRTFIDFFSSQSAVSAHLKSIAYLGPFRQSPMRRYTIRSGAPTEVGAMGEATATLLADEVIRSQKKENILKIGEWLRDLGLAKSVTVVRIGKSDLFDLHLRLKETQVDVTGVWVYINPS